MKNITIAILGEPNVGKSTLLNSILGQKISIVTHKPQTTRNVINGIFIHNQVQMVLLDTPGIFNPKRKIDEYLVKAAWNSIKLAEIAVILLNGTRELSEESLEIISKIKQSKKRFVIAINKSDVASEQEIEDKILSKIPSKPEAIFKISAINKDYENLITYLANQASEEGWIYDADEITTLSSKFLAQEITREKAMVMLDQEIPYNLIIETENFQESQGEIKIWQVIKVATMSHKKIIIGTRGDKIKKIGQSSRIELEKFFECKVHLFLHVQVRPDFLNKYSVFEM